MKKIEFKKAGEFVKNVYNKIGKKNIIVALAILVIGGAVFANYMLFSDPVDVFPNNAIFKTSAFNVHSVGGFDFLYVSRARDRVCGQKRLCYGKGRVVACPRF